MTRTLRATVVVLAATLGGATENAGLRGSPAGAGPGAWGSPDYDFRKEWAAYAHETWGTPADAEWWGEFTDDEKTHGLYHVFQQMAGIMADKPVKGVTHDRRRVLTGDISDDYCSQLGINADTAPAGNGFDYTTYPPSKPCTTGTENCPGTFGEYVGSVFQLDDGISFQNGKGNLKYLTAWGWTNSGHSTDWSYWMATCFYMEYEDGLAVNPEKGDIVLDGTNGAVQCKECFVDMGAKIVVAFKYLYNKDADGVQGDGTASYDDYEIKVHAGGDFDYNLDYSMDAPDFNIGTDDWQTTTMPAGTVIGPIPVYGTSAAGISVTVEPTGSMKTKGKIESSGGSFSATASLDTDIEAYATYEKGNSGLSVGGDVAVTYEPLAFTAETLTLTSSSQLYLDLVPEFGYVIKATLGTFGYTGWEFELSTSLVVPIQFDIEVAIEDGNSDPASTTGCKTTYVASMSLNYAIIAFGDEGEDNTVTVLPMADTPMSLGALLQGEGAFCAKSITGGFQSEVGTVSSSAATTNDDNGGSSTGSTNDDGGGGGGGGSDDDEGLDAGAISGITIACLLFVFLIGAGAYVVHKQTGGDPEVMKQQASEFKTKVRKSISGMTGGGAAEEAPGAAAPELPKPVPGVGPQKDMV